METSVDSRLLMAVSAVFGLAVGSFANVVVYRSPRDGLSCFRPSRSFCPACNSLIAWRDNIPVVSWFLLKGRCRNCHNSISVRYPVVEVAVGVLFAAVFWMQVSSVEFSLARTCVGFYLAATCLVVSLIDLEHLIIPDSITVPGMVLGLLSSAVFPVLQFGNPGFRVGSEHSSALMASFFGILAGAGSLMVVGLLGNVLLRRRLQEAGVQDAMGWGDVKWMGLAGAFLGASSVMGAILVGCLTGAVTGIGMKVIARLRGTGQPVGIPFGPFLSIGILIEYGLPGITLAVLERFSRVA